MDTIESYFEPLIGLNEDGFIDIETAIFLAEKIQLDTMKDVAFHMGLMSDMSTKTQGYRNLLERIKKLEL